MDEYQNGSKPPDKSHLGHLEGVLKNPILLGTKTDPPWANENHWNESWDEPGPLQRPGETDVWCHPLQVVLKAVKPEPCDVRKTPWQMRSSRPNEIDPLKKKTVV